MMKRWRRMRVRRRRRSKVVVVVEPVRQPAEPLDAAELSVWSPLRRDRPGAEGRRA